MMAGSKQADGQGRQRENVLYVLTADMLCGLSKHPQLNRITHYQREATAA